MKGIRVEGLREVEKALMDMRASMDLKRATVKNTVKRALIDAAKPFEDDAVARAPVNIGTLRRSIKSGKPLAKRIRGEHTKESELEVFIGPADLPQAMMQEFGTEQHNAQPFMRPAWDRNRMGILNRIASSIWKEIDKTAERAARKAARAIAKAKL